MDGNEIKQHIDFLNDQIRTMMFPSVFTLNNGIANIMQEIKELQEECPHEYEEGCCKYCYKKED